MDLFWFLLGAIVGALAILGVTLPRRHRAVSITLALPTVIRKGTLQVANFEILDDTIVTIPILTDDAGGNPVSPPSGDTFTVVSSNPTSLAAVIGATAAGNPAVVLTPGVQASPNITITVSDSAGLTTFAQLCDVVTDATPKAITLDLADATTQPQPVPPNAGP
jgi:hypothetical protein